MVKRRASTTCDIDQQSKDLHDFPHGEFVCPSETVERSKKGDNSCHLTVGGSLHRSSKASCMHADCMHENASFMKQILHGTCGTVGVFGWLDFWAPILSC